MNRRVNSESKTDVRINSGVVKKSLGAVSTTSYIIRKYKYNKQSLISLRECLLFIRDKFRGECNDVFKMWQVWLSFYICDSSIYSTEDWTTLKIMRTAMSKCPSFKGKVWRGVQENVEYPYMNRFRSFSKKLELIKPFIKEHDSLISYNGLSIDLSRYSPFDEGEVINYPMKTSGFPSLLVGGLKIIDIDYNGTDYLCDCANWLKINLSAKEIDDYLSIDVPFAVWTSLDWLCATVISTIDGDDGEWMI
jgi:hypothetical protein